MSRKAREDRSSWKTPSVYFFSGDYGPFRAKGYNPIEQVLVLLYYSQIDGERDKEGRHVMFPFAGEAQHLLLRKKNNDNNTSGEEELSSFSNGIMIINVRSMLDNSNDDNDSEVDNDEVDKNDDNLLEDVILKESEEKELTKGFGKHLLKLFQRMLLQNIVLAAHGNLCEVLLKIYKALAKIDPDIISELWLLHPKLSTKFVNTHLVMDDDPTKKNSKKTKKNKRGKTIKKNHNDSTVTATEPMVNVVPLNLIVNDISNNRVELLRRFFPDGATNTMVATTKPCSLVDAAAVANRDSSSTTMAEDEFTNYSYESDYCNEVGKLMFLSKVKVEMSYHTKQYERISEDITTQLTEIKLPQLKNNDTLTQLLLDEDDTMVAGNLSISSSRYVGALALRGNRCILVRSLEGEWDGMRIPVVERLSNESSQDAAIRAITTFADVDPEAVKILPKVLPVPLYAPNGRPVLVHLYPLYAADPPPDGVLEDADMEDEDDYYDWYTYANASKRLAYDPASLAALQIMSLSLVSASKAGLIPNKWGGVLGQELCLD